MAQGDIGNVVDLIDIERIQDSTVILKSGGLRQVVMVGGTNFSLKSEADQNVLTAAYQNFLNSLNFSLQIIIHSRKINIEAYLKTLEDRKNQEVSPILQNQIGEYQAFVRSFVAENPIMVKTFLVVVPYSAPVVPKTSGLMSFLPFGNKQAAAEKSWR
jgi:type IV secretory pathway VirB4 component